MNDEQLWNEQLEHNGVKVVLRLDDHRFVARYGPDDESNAYDSWERVTAAIDARLKRDEQSKRVKLAIPVMDAALNKYTLTGIHSGHGGLLLTPKPSGYNHPDVYYVGSVVEALLKEDAELDKRRREIEKQLRSFRLNSSPYNRSVDTNDGLVLWAERMKQGVEGGAA